MAVSRKILGTALLIGGLIGLVLLIPGLFGDGGAPLRVLLGWGGFVVTAGLLAAGLLLITQPEAHFDAPWVALIFAELLFLALLVLSHIGRANPLGAALAGEGGGLVGWAGSELLLSVMGVTAARVLTLLVAVGAGVGVFYGLHRSAVAQPAEPMPIPTTLAIPAGLSFRPFLDWVQRGGVLIGAGAAQLGGQLAGWRSLWRLGESDDSAGASPEALDDVLAESPPSHRLSARPSAPPPQAAPAKPPASPKRAKPRAGSLPQMDLLAPTQTTNGGGADVRQRAQTLKQTLAEFGVPVEVVSIKEGPTVTQFGLEPGEIIKELRNGETQRRRVSVHSILRLNNDLALALAAPSIRIEAPVPGRPYVGIEIPNTDKTMVGLRGILESKQFAKVASPLALALGRDVSGDPIVVDLTKMPHLLIAGATGSGKSVCLNAIISSLLMNNTAQQVQFVMVDPKMVELPAYNGIPHLVGPVITDTSKAPGALAWLTMQMDDRYRHFAESGVRNIEQYNQKLGKKRQDEALPYLMLIIDEMADLMMNSGFDIERQICRLAQMSRATGIHLILATQRPSVDVITGLIKANFPARVAFAVTSQIDSRVILDTPGAERLLGRGDMLFMSPDSAKLARIQGCFVSDREIEGIVDFWKTRADDAPAVVIPPWAGLLDDEDPTDELLDQAIALIRARDQISTSMLQRQLRIGFPRAARLMEQLEDMGAVGPDEGGGRSRAVLLGESEELA